MNGVADSVCSGRAAGSRGYAPLAVVGVVPAAGPLPSDGTDPFLRRPVTPAERVGR